MNRGSMFHMPTKAEWYDFNVSTLKRFDVPRPSPNDDTPSGVYLLTNYMPALVMRLTRPHLAWCLDTDLLERRETRINIGSSFYVMDSCILGPSLHYLNASRDPKTTQYVESFAKEVSDGLRWIFEVYSTTNILEQHDRADVELRVARNIRNKQAFGSYTPVRLMTELKESTTCEPVPTHGVADRQAFVQPFGYNSGTSAPIGSAGQFARPHLGTAYVRDDCSNDPNDILLSDPYSLSAKDKTTLEEIIVGIREEMANKYYTSIFKSASGIAPIHRPIQTASTCATTCFRGERNSSVDGVERKTSTTTTGGGNPTMEPTADSFQPPQLQPFVYGNTQSHREPEFEPADADMSMTSGGVGGDDELIDTFFGKR